MKEATPKERTQIVLRLIEEQPRRANLQGAVLRGIDLRRADLDEANLEGADLSQARLQGVILSTCNLKHIYLKGAWLDKTRLHRDQLGEAIGEELDGDYTAAKVGYLTLKQNFKSLGDYRGVSWAHRKERRMEKLAFLQQARQAFAARRWQTVIGGCFRYGIYQFVEWLCDYGESISRVLASLAVMIVAFTLFYGVSGGVLRTANTSAGVVRQPTTNPVELLIFSLGTITRMSSVGLQPRNQWIELMAGVEGFLGVALSGLLGFVIGHRLRQA